jgi:hypothetical protein
LLSSIRLYAAFFICFCFHFAQRAFCAAEIFRRAAADIVRLFLTGFRTTDRLLPLSLRSTEIVLTSFLTCPAIRLRSCSNFQAWFTGLNPELNDRVPIRLLREEDVETVGPEILGAVRAFLAGG